MDLGDRIELWINRTGSKSETQSDTNTGQRQSNKANDTMDTLVIGLDRDITYDGTVEMAQQIKLLADNLKEPSLLPIIHIV